MESKEKAVKFSTSMHPEVWKILNELSGDMNLSRAAVLTMAVKMLASKFMTNEEMIALKGATEKPQKENAGKE